MMLEIKNKKKAGKFRNFLNWSSTASLYVSASYVKDQLTMFIKIYLWDLCSVPLTYFSIVLQYHSINCCRFIVNLEFVWHKSSNFVFLQYCISYTEYFASQYELQNKLLTSIKLAGILELCSITYQTERNWHLNNIDPLYTWTWNNSPFTLLLKFVHQTFMIGSVGSYSCFVRFIPIYLTFLGININCIMFKFQILPLHY